MNFFKVFRVLLLIFLILSSTTTYGGWPGDIGPKIKGVFQKNLFSPENYARTELSFILKRNGIRDDLPEEILKEFMDARENPSKLFESWGFREIETNQVLYSEHTEAALSIKNYRSALEVLQSKVHRDFFFSLFDPGNLDHLGDLFMGLRAHQVPYREISFEEALEISRLIRTDPMWDEWVLFRKMAEQAVSKGQLKVGVIDIEASFFSAFGQRGFLPWQPSGMQDSFKAFTDNLISKAEESGRLVDLYKSPYFRLPVRSPYRGNFLAALQRSDLSDKDMILKWWEDVHISNITTAEQHEFLKPYIKKAFDLANRGGHFDEAVFMGDPFISELMRATQESDRLNRAVSEILSSLKQERGRRGLQDYDIDTVTS